MGVLWPTDHVAEEIAEQRAVQVIGRELMRHCNEGELKFKQPLGIVTDMCQINERLPGTGADVSSCYADTLFLSID